MGLREEYQEKIEAQLKEWAARLEELKGKAAKAKAEAREELSKQVDKLRASQEEAQRKLQELREAGAETWGKVKPHLDKGMEDLKKAWDRLVSKRGEQRD
jgi:predicted nuclease with TOPRIM domain